MNRTKQDIITRMNEIGVHRRVCLGACPISATRSADDIDMEARKIPFTLISKDNAGERFDWWEGEVYIEELDVQGANYQGLRTFFTDHRPSVDTAAGRVEDTHVDGEELKASVVFGSDARSDMVFNKYVENILTDVSIGYRVNDVVVTSKKDEPDHVLVTDFEIVELSAVWKGFDPGANIGRATPSPAMDGRNTDSLKRQLQLKEKLS